MKRITLISITVLALITACTPSAEERISDLVGQEVRNSLIAPDSYDPIDVRIDTAWTTSDSTGLYRAMQDVMGTLDELTEKELTLDSLETIYNIVKGYINLLNPDNVLGLEDMPQYQKNKKRVNDNIRYLKDDIKATTDRCKADIDWIRRRLQAPKEPIGYRAVHRFRSQDNEGKVRIDTVTYLIDKEITRIIESIPQKRWEEMMRVKEGFDDLCN